MGVILTTYKSWDDPPSTFPKDRGWGVGVVPLPNGLYKWLLNGGLILTTYKSWEDPLSRKYFFTNLLMMFGNVEKHHENPAPAKKKSFSKMKARAPGLIQGCFVVFIYLTFDGKNENKIQAFEKLLQNTIL